jgi:hypothetical protein
VRIFIIVAKSRPELYRYFLAAFEGIKDIEVIVDRRIGSDDALRTAEPSRPDDRRIPRNVYEELEQRGFVIVRLAP